LLDNANIINLLVGLYLQNVLTNDIRGIKPSTFLQYACQNDLRGVCEARPVDVDQNYSLAAQQHRDYFQEYIRIIDQ
jgi:hypothetical protein